jgi:hypothetical protein
MQMQVLPSRVNPGAQPLQKVAVSAQAVQIGLQGEQAVAPAGRKVAVMQTQVVP